MNTFPVILFCEDPFNSKHVDPDFLEQYEAALKVGFTAIFFSFDELIQGDNPERAIRKINPSEKQVEVLYRGWMLTVAQYETLFDLLRSKNYWLINNPTAYRHCHYLPENLSVIRAFTPETISRKIENERDIDLLIQQASIFGEKPVIIKDYVKSEKHHWETACYVKNAADNSLLKNAIQTLITLRGNSFNEGICVREFVELKPLTIHTKSGMPLTEEYRLFFLYGKLVDCFAYWEEGEYPHSFPDTRPFESIAATIQSNFFSMDIARLTDESFIIVELGDGQVAGLPDEADPAAFYTKLKELAIAHSDKR